MVGTWYFSNILEAAESFGVLHSDLEALFGGDPYKQAAVIDKSKRSLEKWRIGPLRI